MPTYAHGLHGQGSDIRVRQQSIAGPAGPRVLRGGCTKSGLPLYMILVAGLATPRMFVLLGGFAKGVAWSLIGSSRNGRM